MTTRTPEDVARAVARQTGWDPDADAAEREWTAVGMGPVGRHRDSDALARSNFDVIYADLSERFGESVDIARFGHWAVGWVEEIIFDVGNEPCEAVVAAWKEKLDGYPIANEDHYSNLEWEELNEYLDTEIPAVLRSLGLAELTAEGFADLDRLARSATSEETTSVDDVGDITEIVREAYCAVLASDRGPYPEPLT